MKTTRNNKAVKKNLESGLAAALATLANPAATADERYWAQVGKTEFEAALAK